MQSPYIFSLIYVWSKLEPDRKTLGCPAFKAYLVWILICLHLFIGGNPFNDAIGVAAGYIYVCLKTPLFRSVKNDGTQTKQETSDITKCEEG